MEGERPQGRRPPRAAATSGSGPGEAPAEPPRVSPELAPHCPTLATVRTNRHFTLKTNPLKRADLDEFVACYLGGGAGEATGDGSRGRSPSSTSRHERVPTWTEATPEGRWRAFDYEELAKRDKCSLDLFWLKDKSLEDSDDLPDPDLLAQEIMDDLATALEQFGTIHQRLTS